MGRQVVSDVKFRHLAKRIFSSPRFPDNFNNHFFACEDVMAKKQGGVRIIDAAVFESVLINRRVLEPLFAENVLVALLALLLSRKVYHQPVVRHDQHAHRPKNLITRKETPSFLRRLCQLVPKKLYLE